jgi:hypothetical protein
MKRWKKILLVIVVILVIMQFFRPPQNMSDDILATDIDQMYNVPDDVSELLQNSCYDCHSNNTIYPWYSTIEPLGWWLSNHIKEGKRHLNFSDFGSYSKAKQFHKLDQIMDEVKEGDMPLSTYTFGHPSAALKDSDKVAITNWCLAIQDSMKARYPADSLVMPKK